MRKLFGTDGIRGIAGKYPLDAKTVFSIGRALGHHLSSRAANASVVIGQDTRESSEWIATTLGAGLSSVRVRATSTGVITTPGVAYLARAHGFQAGIVISASHNPWPDNGIKVFGPDGFKLPDNTELEIEKEIFSQVGRNSADVPCKDFSLRTDRNLLGDYEKWLKSTVAFTDVSKLRVVADCANGAAAAIVPELFADIGIRAEYIHRQPNGRNINENCGALHPAVVARKVVARKADIGVTFDGDADRALFADASGKVVNGDAVMWLFARELKSANKLKKNTVVGTTMSNMGLEVALQKEGVTMLRAPVGDKYVLEEMLKSGASLGGEQSGHIILSDIATTGDGILTALKVLEMVAQQGKPIGELISDLKVYPQVIKNVRVREKQPLEKIAAVTEAIKQAEDDLATGGRVVVRYSGTEPLARVMIEAESEEKMTRHADAIAATIQQALGA